ncbi:DGQHR domain-containing protein [Emticicia soli]|uniref:DGQHR domain-containing protein n=1 Tax=Emticicia soli TaxID=2027878 RepID=A0ABW5JFL7_9BACT
MNTQKIVSGQNTYLSIDLVQINQKEKSFYIGKIKASDFLEIFTVRPAQYDLEKHTALLNSFPEESDYYEHLITEDKTKIKEKDFQREANTERISSISKFLNEEEYAFFPNTIIANCELINNWEDYNLNENSSSEDYFSITDKPNYLSFLKKNTDNDMYSLYIPFIKNSVLIIDGQHRLEGLKKTVDSIQNNYDLIISFLIGFDRSIIAKQFYTINYEQKPVNKSLLYQLTGEFARDMNELSFMHNVAKLLNEIPESPFHGRIKMLGVTPRNYPEDKKRLLSISQAFFIDSTIRFISSKAKNTLYPPIFLKFYKDVNEHIIIVRTLARFFNAVQTIKTDWAQPESSVISKGLGVTALLKVFSFLFQIILKDKLEGDWNRVKDLKTDTFIEVLRGLENVDFSSDGPYGKTGGEASITKIKNGIISNLSFLGSPSNVQNFENDFRENYLLWFNEKIQNVGV